MKNTNVAAQPMRVLFVMFAHCFFGPHRNMEEQRPTMEPKVKMTANGPGEKTRNQETNWRKKEKGGGQVENRAVSLTKVWERERAVSRVPMA